MRILFSLDTHQKTRLNKQPFSFNTIFTLTLHGITLTNAIIKSAPFSLKTEFTHEQRNTYQLHELLEAKIVFAKQKHEV